MRMLTKALMICLILTISGCVYAPIPKLPDIKLAPCPLVKPAEKAVCPSIGVPAPVPKNLIIELSNGKVVKIDAEGENFLREYIATRKSLKSAWHGSF